MSDVIAMNKEESVRLLKDGCIYKLEHMKPVCGIIQWSMHKFTAKKWISKKWILDYDLKTSADYPTKSNLRKFFLIR